MQSSEYHASQIDCNCYIIVDSHENGHLMTDDYRYFIKRNVLPQYTYEWEIAFDDIYNNASNISTPVGESLNARLYIPQLNWLFVFCFWSRNNEGLVL